MGDGELYKRHSTLQLAGEHTHVFKAILSLPTGEYQHPLDRLRLRCLQSASRTQEPTVPWRNNKSPGIHLSPLGHAVTAGRDVMSLLRWVMGGRWVEAERRSGLSLAGWAQTLGKSSIIRRVQRDCWPVVIHLTDFEQSLKRESKRCRAAVTEGNSGRANTLLNLAERQTCEKEEPRKRQKSSPTKLITNGWKQFNSTQLLLWGIYSHHIMFVTQYKARRQCCVAQVHKYGLAGDIWRIRRPGANSATSARLEMRSNEDGALPEGVARGLGSVMTQQISVSSKSTLCHGTLTSLGPEVQHLPSTPMS